MDDNDKKNQDIFEKMRWLDSLQPLKNIMPPSFSALNSASALNVFQNLTNLSSPAVNSAVALHKMHTTVGLESHAVHSAVALHKMNTTVGIDLHAVHSAAGLHKLHTTVGLDSSVVQGAKVSIQSLFKSVGSYEKVVDIINSSTSYLSIFKAFDKVVTINPIVMNDLSKHISYLESNKINSAFKLKTVFADQLITASSGFDFLREMIEIVDEGSDIDGFSINEEKAEYLAVKSDEVENVVDDLLKTSSSIGIIDKFKKLSPTLQIIIISILIHFIIPQANSAFGFFVNKYLENEFSVDSVSKRGAIKEVKSLSRDVQLVDFSGLRFITGTGVRLRKDHTIKSDVLDELVFGQVVEVHSKKKNWIEVSYQYEDGTYMNGWVFTRYTARFVK